MLKKLWSMITGVPPKAEPTKPAAQAEVTPTATTPVPLNTEAAGWPFPDTRPPEGVSTSLDVREQEVTSGAAQANQAKKKTSKPRTSKAKPAAAITATKSKSKKK